MKIIIECECGDICCFEVEDGHELKDNPPEGAWEFVWSHSKHKKEIT